MLEIERISTVRELCIYRALYNYVYLRLNSVECTVTTYRLHGLGFECQQGQDKFFFSKTFLTVSGANPSSYSMGAGFVSLFEAKQPGRAVGHLPLSNVEISKNV